MFISIKQGREKQKIRANKQKCQRVQDKSQASALQQSGNIYGNVMLALHKTDHISTAQYAPVASSHSWILTLQMLPDIGNAKAYCLSLSL